jgi:phage baseplate assembly protein W
MALNDNNRFLGSGMAFPPQANKATGRFVISDSEKSVKESVYLILMTARGERWLDLGFGSSLSKYAFMDVSITNLSILRDDLRKNIIEQEPRVSEVDIEVDAASRADCLVLNVHYKVAGNNALDNLVFPFFLKAQGSASGSDEEML